MVRNQGFENGDSLALVRQDLNSTVAWVSDYTYNTNDWCIVGGKIYTSLVDDNEGNSPVEGAYWTESVLQKYGNLLPEDIERLHCFVKSDKGVKLAILGDSTTVGIGYRVSVYGECADKNTPVAYEKLPMAIMYNSPYYLPFDKTVSTVYKEGSIGVSFTVRFPSIQLVVSSAPNLTYTYDHDLKAKRNTLTVVYLKRKSTAAPTFDIVTNGATTTCDTYKSDITFGSAGAVAQAGFDICTQEVAISTTGDTFDFTINNLQLLSRGGAAVASDGTVVIIGFYYGKAIDFRNYAISSTTLTNASASNTIRGITTTGQLNKAYSFGANVFIIGWGTNDSKTAVTTIEQFKLDYTARIEEIRAYNPEAIIILVSTDKGETGSQYQNNYLYFQAMRDVAFSNNVSFFDAEALFNRYTRTDVIYDTVHPNSAGYLILGEAITTMFGFSNQDKALQFLSLESRVQTLENAGMSSVDPAVTKAEENIVTAISSVVADPANIKRLIFFDTLTGTVLADRSVTAVDGTLSASASSMTQQKIGNVRTLYLNNTIFSFDDADDLSFTTGSADTPFSLLWAGMLPTTGWSGKYLIAKRTASATGPVYEPEYQFMTRAGAGFQTVLFKGGTESIYIGRYVSTAPPVDSLLTAITTYSGSGTNAGIKIYQNGTKVDNTDFSSGTYTSMVAGSSPVRNCKDVDDIINVNSSAYFSIVAIIAEELSASDVSVIDAAIRLEMGDMSLYEKLSNKGVANGYAGLDSSGVVPSINLPATSGISFPFNEQLILNQLDTIVGSAYIKRLLFFDVATGTVITDRSANAIACSLSANATTIAQSIFGTLKNMNLLGQSYSIPDADDLSFCDGSSDLPFSLVWAGKLNATGYDANYLIAKRSKTGATLEPEYQFLVRGAAGLGLYLFKGGSESIYIGRYSSSPPPTNTLLTAISTYSGSGVKTGIKIYQNGTQVDTTDFASGTYTKMTNGSSPVRNGKDVDGVMSTVMQGKFACVAIISKELSATEVAKVDKLLRTAMADDVAGLI